MSTLNGLSLSTGYGGLDLGLKEVLGDTLEFAALCEIEVFPIANLISKMEHGLMPIAPIWTNLKTFPYTEFKNKIDLLCAGFPCQPFSMAGPRHGQDSPKHLWPDIFRGIRELGTPTLVFLENVEGIINANLKKKEGDSPAGTNVTEHIIEELARLGYIATVGAFSASGIGAPHRRRRIFFLGVHMSVIDRPEMMEKVAELVDGYMDTDFPVVKEVLAAFSQIKDVGAVEREAAKERSKQAKPESWDITDVILQHFDFEESRVKQGFPANKSQKPFSWEPPRLIRKDSEGKCDTADSLPDELKLLGNGVVPAQASEAFCWLFRQIVHILMHDYEPTL